MKNETKQSIPFTLNGFSETLSEAFNFNAINVNFRQFALKQIEFQKSAQEACMEKNRALLNQCFEQFEGMMKVSRDFMDYNHKLYSDLFKSVNEAAEKQISKK